METCVQIAAACSESVLLTVSFEETVASFVENALEGCICTVLRLSAIPQQLRCNAIVDAAWHAVVDCSSTCDDPLNITPVALVLCNIDVLDINGCNLLCEMLQYRTIPIPSLIRRRIPAALGGQGGWHAGLASLPRNMCVIACAGSAVPPALDRSFFLRCGASGSAAVTSLTPKSTSLLRYREITSKASLVPAIPVDTAAFLHNSVFERRMRDAARLMQGTCAVLPRSSDCGALPADTALPFSASAPPPGSVEALIAEYTELQKAADAAERCMFASADQVPAAVSRPATVLLGADAAKRVSRVASALAALQGCAFVTPDHVASALQWALPAEA